MLSANWEIHPDQHPVRVRRMSTFENILTWLGGGVGVGGGVVGGKWFLEWLSGRIDRREQAAEVVRKHLDEATGNIITTMANQIKALTERQEHVDELLSECREQHARAQEELASLRGLVQGWGEAKQLAQVNLSADRVVDRRTPKVDPES
jgi:hypothetical protein